MGAVLFSYGFDYKKLRSYTAPWVRLSTDKIFNHGSLFVFAWGEYWLIESAEHGVTITPLAQALDRYKARIEIRPYIGTLKPGAVYSEAVVLRGTSYDNWALLHQLVYRRTGRLTKYVNCFIGRDRFKGIWIGKTGEAANGKFGCFELLFHLLGLPNAHLASGVEFDQLDCFGAAIYSEL
jgi:hypothetical protein